MSSPKNTTTQTPQANAELNQKLDRIIELLEAGAAQPPPRPFIPAHFLRLPLQLGHRRRRLASYIHLEDGSMASLRTGKGSTDHWFSVKLADGEYGEHYLKFHRASPPDGLLVVPSLTSPPPPAKPVKQAQAGQARRAPSTQRPAPAGAETRPAYARQRRRPGRKQRPAAQNRKPSDAPITASNGLRRNRRSSATSPNPPNVPSAAKKPPASSRASKPAPQTATRRPAKKWASSNRPTMRPPR